MKQLEGSLTFIGRKLEWLHHKHEQASTLESAPKNVHRGTVSWKQPNLHQQNRQGHIGYHGMQYSNQKQNHTKTSETQSRDY